MDNIGAWLSYIATLSLVEEFSGGSGLALSGVVLIRFLPSLILAPVTGVVADRCVGEPTMRRRRRAAPSLPPSCRRTQQFVDQHFRHVLLCISNASSGPSAH